MKEVCPRKSCIGAVVKCGSSIHATPAGRGFRGERGPVIELARYAWGGVSLMLNQGMPNQALEQTRESVLRYGEVVGCELLNFFVRDIE